MTSIQIQRNVLAPSQLETCSIQAQKVSDIGAVIQLPKPCIVFVNEDPVPASEWADYPLKSADTVRICALPLGGGGGSNPMRAIATLVVVAAAAYYAPGLAAKMGLAEGGFASASLTAGLTMAGTVLLNTVMPLPKPSLSGFGEVASASPTYALSAQGNQARVGEPIPVVYGRHVVYPDFAARPFTEYIGDDQYLYQLHCIGAGEFDVEALRIEDTPLANFDDITHEIIPPNGTVTLFNPNVVASPEIAGQTLAQNDAVGPFIANPSETQAGKLSVDISCPEGLFVMDAQGNLTSNTVSWTVEGITVDDAGNTTGNWQTLGTHSMTEARQEPVRRTYHYTVSAGRYMVKLTRTNAESTSTSARDTLRWEALRAEVNTTPDYGNVTLLAVKMRATDNLSQRSSRMINAIVTRKLPVWHPVNGWSTPVATQSIAWALADICRNSDYGAGLPDDRIDLNALHALEQIWQARGDTFGGVFDTKSTVWECLTQVAACGRCKQFSQGGVMRFVRDEQRSFPVQTFSPRNIVKGSFFLDFLLPNNDTADCVVVEYFNEKTWKPDEVKVALAGSSQLKEARVRMLGITNKSHAEREGLYIAATNRYRREIGRFETELEGLIVSYGDLIHIAHDMPGWAESGEIVRVVSGVVDAGNYPAGTVLKLSEPVTFSGVGDHYLWLRGRDGAPQGPYLVTQVSPVDTDLVQLGEPVPEALIYLGTTAERTHFAFGTVDNAPIRAIVTSVRPRGSRVEVGFSVENNSVHAV